MAGHKQWMLYCYVLLLYLSILGSMLLLAPVYAMTSTLTVVPSSITTGLEQNFNIDIAISDVFDLYGWEFTLTWNPYLLEALSAIEGPFLKGDERATFFTYNIISNDGKIVIDCTLLGWISGISGSGILATVTFSPRNYGECPLGLYNLSLIDSNERLILCQTSDGYVQVVSPHDVAVSMIDVSPLLASIEDPVNIKVSVQNEGDYPEVFEVTAYVNSTIIGTQQTSLNGGSSAKVSFAWNTTGYTKGDYLILATVGPVPGEVDLMDNTKTADSPVTILTPGHDVGVVAIWPAKTVIAQGYNLALTVKVRNYGVFSETFNVTAYANTTSIGTCLNITLTSGASATATFTWNTTGFAVSNYTLGAYAWPVQGETDLDDNALECGLVTVSILGDVTGDIWVDMQDISVLIDNFMATPPNWNSNSDINGDLNIDMADIGIAIDHFMQP